MKTNWVETILDGLVGLLKWVFIGFVMGASSILFDRWFFQ